MISIIVPVYNVERYLRDCIESILNQDHTDWELILVDDGSTDSSPAICDEYEKSDHRIKTIHTPNRGLSEARNRGIEIAAGSEICFIDSDDFIKPDFLSTLLSEMISTQADISVCQFIRCNPEGRIISGKQKFKESCLITGNHECMKKFLSDTMINTPACGKLYKSKLFKESDIRYPSGRFCEDIFTTYRIVLKCSRIAISILPLYVYRNRPDSIINSRFSPKHLDAVEGSIERYHAVRSIYPDLGNLASKGVIYSLNSNLRRIMQSDSLTKNDKRYYIGSLLAIYKEYLKEYLGSNAKLSRKIFAIGMRFFPAIAIPFLKFVK